MQDRFARRGFSHRRSQLLCTYIFENIRQRTCFQRRENVLILVIGGQYHDLRTRANLFDTPRRFDAVHAGHDQVHQDDVRDVLGGQFHGLFARPRLAHDRDIRLCDKESAHPLAYHRVIVHEQH